ncbi:hypothetical protein [Micromonospora aurantiaca (nom. illeg.)]|uniref:hypothetical protein n=1 Tax=Micromonospora aurantiaca (nom. illeg.) TaxID=47850 RepID=UPI003F49E429
MTSGRSGTGARPYRRNRAAVLANSDLCHLCNHHGARTVDHIITARDWPRGPDGRHLPGLDNPDNLAPAHGTLGNQALNPCPQGCGLCNQRRGTQPLPTLNRRPW